MTSFANISGVHYIILKAIGGMSNVAQLLTNSTSMFICQVNLNTTQKTFFSSRSNSNNTVSMFIIIYPEV
jgi:hypothetical protein